MCYAYAIADAGSCIISGVTPTTTDITCNGSADGMITLEVNTFGLFGSPNNKGLIISEIMADPDGTDAPFEFVELVATKFINFSTTPYTVVFTNNNNATANGWVHGSNISYAFEINLGIVNAGDVVYVGGSSMQVFGTQIKSVDYTQTAGAAGIGNVSASGILGNGSGSGTGSADGIAVFDRQAGAINSSTVPVDAVFFGTVLNNAVVNGGVDGYELPENDFYSGGKLQSGSPFINLNPISGLSIKLSGVFNINDNVFTTPRTWVNNASFSDQTTEIELEQSFTYAWSNGSTTQNLSNLPSGQYCVTVTDVFSCQSSTCIELFEPDTLIKLALVTPETCFGAMDGSIELFIQGGVPPYNVDWSPFSLTGEFISNLPSGNYTCALVDDVGCTIIDSFLVEAPDEIIISTLSVKDVSCFDNNDGEISIAVSGGTGMLTIDWNGGFSSDLLIDNLVPDFYEVVVTDENNCFVSDFYIINEPDEITFDLDVLNERCFGENNGSVAITNLFGGTGTLMIQYNIGSGVADSFGLATDIPPGDYSVLVSDDNGCSLQEDFTILPAEALAVTANIKMASAQTAADGGIALSVSGGLPPYVFEWSNGDFADSIGGLLPDIYCVDIIDDNGCELSDCFEVDFPVGVDVLASLDPKYVVYRNKNFLEATIEINAPQYLGLKIFSLTGQLMWESKSDAATELKHLIDVSHWHSSVYLVQFQVNQKFITQKILL